MAILADWANGLQDSPLAGRLGVLHTFSGDFSMAQQAINLGFYISISGTVTYKNARQLAEVTRALPLERLLVETDCPFLTPHPHRGKRNEPAYVGLIAQRIAELRGIPLGTLAKATTANARRLFDLPQTERGEEVA
jgi:TatD DNase family protein